MTDSNHASVACSRGMPFSLEPGARRIDKPWGYEILLSPPDAPYTAVDPRARESARACSARRKVKRRRWSPSRHLVLEGPDGQLHEMDAAQRRLPQRGPAAPPVRGAADAGPVFEASTPVGTTLPPKRLRPAPTDRGASPGERAKVKRGRCRGLPLSVQVASAECDMAWLASAKACARLGPLHRVLAGVRRLAVCAQVFPGPAAPLQGINVAVLAGTAALGSSLWRVARPLVPGLAEHGCAAALRVSFASWRRSRAPGRAVVTTTVPTDSGVLLGVRALLGLVRSRWR
jgi:hypothetical protein